MGKHTKHGVALDGYGPCAKGYPVARHRRKTEGDRTLAAEYAAIGLDLEFQAARHPNCGGATAALMLDELEAARVKAEKEWVD